MKRSFMKGNDAIVCAALSVGCRAFFGYPITPASEIAHDAMKAFPMAGALAIQAESEVAAINMLYGAAAAGNAAMTATSGPGLSLMQEGISYLAAAQLPAVIVDIMRSGPGLGNIGPEQSDYFIATKGGGHGHYHTPVYAPNSVQEMFDMTREAFRTAFQFHTPVLVIADAFIGQMMEIIDLADDLPAADEVPEASMPYANRVDGSSQTLGNIVSSLELVPEKLHLKNDARFEKYRQIEETLPDSEVDGPQDAQTIVIAFGICARIGLEAVLAARERGLSIALFRPKTLWPFPQNELKHIAQKATRIVVVECNRGMMAEDIQRFLLRDDIECVSTDGGIIPTSTQILEILLKT